MRAAALLLACDHLMFLDMRGTGVRAHELQPLRRRFALAAPQGAVLSRTASLAAAAVALEAWVCGYPAAHGACAAAPAAAQPWVHTGVHELLAAAAQARRLRDGGGNGGVAGQ